MQILVINLARRTDRLRHITGALDGYEWSRVDAVDAEHLGFGGMALKGWRPDPNWEDPLLRRGLLPGELACFMSHYYCWVHVATTNNAALILEDDVELIAPLRLDKYEQYFADGICDALYLGYREMGTALPHGQDDLVIPEYPYLTSSYCITPATATRLIAQTSKQSIIPVDEYLPILFGYYSHKSPCFRPHVESAALYPPLRAAALKQHVFRQVGRRIFPSDIETSTHLMANTQTPAIHVVTVATDQAQAAVLYGTAQRFAVPVVNIGDNLTWLGGDMTYPGGGHKIALMQQHLRTLPDEDIVLFVDGYDVAFCRDLKTITERYYEMDAEVVVAAEKSCWPDASLAPHFTAQTEYKYPNSGVYMGRVRSLKVLFEAVITESEDDQLYLQNSLLRHKDAISWRLDVENYMFQCMSNASDDVYVKPSGVLTNKATNCCPCVLHGNGVPKDKAAFMELVRQLQPATANTASPFLSFLDPGPVQEVGPEIVMVDFLTPDQCTKLIALVSGNADWKPMENDQFPGDEIRIRSVSVPLFQEIEKHFMEQIAPAIERHWWPLNIYGIRDAFVIKYSPETQKSLACHTDASLVSTITYLNDAYTGGDTYFYRQNFSTAGTPVGKMLLWPGQVTHGHEGREVTSGTKYALVIWTSRRPGEVNY